MKISNRLLFIAALFVLALPLIFTGNANAETFAGDGAVLNGTTGLWELPDTFCVAYPASWTSELATATTTAAGVPAAVKRTTATEFKTYNPASSATACASLSVEPWKTKVKLLATKADCVAKGYYWSSYGAGSCSAAGWTVATSETTWKTTGYDGCLMCHNSHDNRVSPTSQVVDIYLNASHKNASRKIKANEKLANVYENNDHEMVFGIPPYAGLGSKQRAIDWTNGKIQDTASTFLTDGALEYTSWYWTFCEYGECFDKGIYDWKTSATGVPQGKQGGCATCHMTGFSNGNTLETTKEPELSFAGVSWNGVPTTANSRLGKVNLKSVWYPGGANPYSAALTGTDCTGLDGTVVTISGLVTCQKIETGGKETQKTACTTGGMTAATTPWLGSWTAPKKDDPLTTANEAVDGYCSMNAASLYSSWDQFGVVCSNCHNAVDDKHHESGAVRVDMSYTIEFEDNDAPLGNNDGICETLEVAGDLIGDDDGKCETGETCYDETCYEDHTAMGTSVNAVCLQCHVKSGSSGQRTAKDTEQLTLRSKVSGSHPNYHGSQFMNSPHARFSGTYGQLADTTKYDSDFLSNYGGCEGCHNPHGSIREELHHLTAGIDAEPAEGIEATCAACHATVQGRADAIAITSINHPTGAGTPADFADSCVVCHMPNGYHLFRITTDETYAYASAPVAKEDDGFVQAAWISLDLACGQCHGGSGGAGKTTNGAPYISNDSIGQYASVMHGGTAETNLNLVDDVLPPDSCGALTAAGTLSVDGTVCAGDTCNIGVPKSIALNTTGSTGDVFVWWGDGSGIDDGGITHTFTHTYGNVGKFQVIQTVKNDCGEKAQKIFTVNATGGTTGKGTLKIDASGVDGRKISYSVLNSSGVSITNGNIVLDGSKSITLDAGVTNIYSVKIGYEAVQPYGDPVTYRTCAPGTGGGTVTNIAKCSHPAYTTQAACEAAPNGEIWQVTGQLIPSVSVTAGGITTVSLTGCN